MPTKNPKVDAYIAKSAPFAQPILKHLRKVVHAALPGLEEDIKWGMPFFVSGRGPVCHMAAFKAHCAFAFWKGRSLASEGTFSGPGDTGAMGSFGRITALSELPAEKQLAAWIREAAALNDAAAAAPKAPKKPAAPPPKAPADLAKGLRANPEAKARWDAFPPSKRRDYVTWLEEAKAEATREKRLATALEQIAEGKSRMWKYEARMKKAVAEKAPAKKAATKKAAAKRR